MRIWWGFRFGMEMLVFAGGFCYFFSSAGFLYNYRKRYVRHKQKRERTFFKNPYFLPTAERKLKYDKHFNVVKKDNKLLIEDDLKNLKLV